jgi:hypothetical protein
MSVARRGHAVEPEALDPGRSLVGTQVDPHAVDLGMPTPVAGERPAPPGRDCGETAAPRHELHFAVPQKRLVDVDSDSPDKPQMRRRSPAGLLDVVDRDVLKQARESVEPDAAKRVDVGEPQTPAAGECPPTRGDRNRWIEHPGEPIRRSAMRMRGLEPPRPERHTDLNRARLPIPPHPRGATV